MFPDFFRHFRCALREEIFGQIRTQLKRTPNQPKNKNKNSKKEKKCVFLFLEFEV